MSCQALPAASNGSIWPSDSTRAEQERFQTDNPQRAVRNLQRYLEWRRKHDEIRAKLGITNDNDWDTCATVAAHALGVTPKGPVPQMVRVYEQNGDAVRDREGYRILQVFPGRMDEKIVPLSVYSLALCLYIDGQLDPEEKEQMCLIIDVRSGVGWPNKNGAQLIGFIRQTCGTLLTHFPGRLSKCLLYPLPSTFEWVWKLIHRCLDPATADKICVLSGPSTKVSPAPVEQMQVYLYDDCIELMEETRKSMFLEEC